METIAWIILMFGKALHSVNVAEATVTGILGNRADAVAWAGVRGIFRRLMTRRQPLDHDLQAAVRRAYVYAQLITAAGCVRELEPRLRFVVSHSPDVAWLLRKVDALKRQVREVEKGVQDSPLTHLSELEALVIAETEPTVQVRLDALQRRLVAELIAEPDIPDLYRERLSTNLLPLMCDGFSQQIEQNESLRNVLQTQILASLDLGGSESAHDTSTKLLGQMQHSLRVIGASTRMASEWFRKLDDHLTDTGQKIDDGFQGVGDGFQDLKGWIELTLNSVMQTSFTEVRDELSQLRALVERFPELQKPSPEQSRSLQNDVERLRTERWQSEKTSNTSRRPIPHLLPSLRGEFVDRVNQSNALRRLLQSKQRLVVIIAPPGHGKTELIAKLLEEAAPRSIIQEPDLQGILYLRCAGGNVELGRIFEDAGQIVGKGDEFRGIWANRGLTLERKLAMFFTELSASGNVWVVMDNFECLLEKDGTISNAELRSLVETTASTSHRVQLLLTTRAMPILEGGRTLPSVGLEEGLEEPDAIAYLRAEGVECGLADAEEDMLGEAVNRVYCIPKALESIVGYLLERYPVVRLGDLMRNSALFEDFVQKDSEKGLRKLIAEQLSDQTSDAQLVLSALSVFHKPAPLAGLRWLLPALDWEAVLPRLHRNRLVFLDGECYDLHPLVRECAYSRIPDEFPSTLTLAFPADYDAPFTRPALHARTADFYSTLRVPEEQCRTIGDLEPHLDEFYHHIRGRQFTAAAHIADRLDVKCLLPWGHAGTVIELREQLVDRLDDPSLVGTNVWGLGLAYGDVGRLREAKGCYQEALHSFREQKDRRAISECLGRLGNAYRDLGEPRKAIDCFQEALAISREILADSREVGDRRLEGNELGRLGSVYGYLNEPWKAIECHEQALAIHQETGDREWEGIDLGNLGNVFRELGEPKKAKMYQEQALVIHREVDDRRSESIDLSQLGRAYRDLGQPWKAIECHEQALSIHRETGNQRWEAIDLDNLGNVYADLDEPQKAIGYFSRALDLHRKTGDRRSEGTTLGHQGEVHLRLGEIKESVALCKEALAAAESSEHVRSISFCQLVLGQALFHLGRLQEARRYYEEALDLDVPLTRYVAAACLGVLHLAEGRNDDAGEHLARSEEFCRALLAGAAEMSGPHIWLAFTLLATGRARESMELYRQALEDRAAKGVVREALWHLRHLQSAAPVLEGVQEVILLLAQGAGEEPVDDFGRDKEQDGDEAVAFSPGQVDHAEPLFLDKFAALASLVASETDFYQHDPTTFEGTVARVHRLRQAVEDNDGYQYLYDDEGEPVSAENDLRMAVGSLWLNVLTAEEVDRRLQEKQMVPVEFKLASNKDLSEHLNIGQAEAKEAEGTGELAPNLKVTAIFTFSADEYQLAEKYTKEVNTETYRAIVIDASKETQQRRRQEENVQPERRTRAFISYSHDREDWHARGEDSETQRKRVLDLAEKLRHDGIDCIIDQHIANPTEGWQKWMMNQVEEADFVLVVATATYNRRFRGKEEPDKGHGAQWESMIITQDLYDANGRNDKFIPIIFDRADAVHIPFPLRSATYYTVSDPTQLEDLYWRLTHQLERPTILGPVRQRRPHTP